MCVYACECVSVCLLGGGGGDWKHLNKREAVNGGASFMRSGPPVGVSMQ